MNDRRLSILVLCCVALTLTLGIAKVLVQKAHPPAYATPTHNTYEGYLSIDRYALRAERLRDWIVGEDEEAGTLLRTELREHGHPTSILIPLLVALASLATGSIPVAFIALNCLATLAQVLLTMRIARVLLPSSRRISLAAGVLAAGHITVIRTAGQLHCDPANAALALASVLLTLLWLERPGWRTALLLVGVQVAGGLTKLTFLPFLVGPALLALFHGSHRGLGAALRSALFFGLGPLLPVLLYVGLVSGLEGVTGDAVQSFSASGRGRQLLVEMALLLQLLPFACILGSRPGRSNVGILALALVHLAFVAVTGLPDHRLYLPLVGLLAATAALSLHARCSDATLLRLLLGYALLNYGIAVAGITMLTQG